MSMTTTHTKANFAQTRQEAEAQGLLSRGDYYKFKEGGNRFRLLSNCLPHASTYKGERNFKWLCYVLDRRDGKVKAFFMPHKIYRAIEDLQMNDDYAFADVPMPYDLTVNATDAGTINVKYTVVPARKNTELTSAEWADLEKQKPLDELQAKLKEKAQKTAPPVSDDHDFNPADYEDDGPDHGQD